MSFRLLLGIVLSSILSMSAFASIIQMRTGDIILQPLDCKMCTVIEQEENTIFSHIGVVFVDKKNDVYVVEAYGKVRQIPLAQFLEKTEKGQKSVVYRNVTLENLYRYDRKGFEMFRNGLIDAFLTIDQADYDSEFLWNNYSDDGREKYYCSELVAKLLNPFIEEQILPKKMHFNKNREMWLKYFGGDIPDGELGISPGDFERSQVFTKVFEIH